ncbi:MAG TPA: arabinose ABC transporter permease [Eggerthellaceae bacterium]|nr:arabinose ABC transporter permease [Eggerthellaceae bacterium]
MVSPARTVVQADFGIDGTVGIWMINIYTLFYAALIPIIGKLADRRGRKRVFTACVGIFCIGAVACGLSKTFGGFGLLLFGRVLQAAGAGGMLPVANAEIGATFPDDKRGMALGIAAVTGGVSNVLGAVVGSAIVGALGLENWPAMFYLCVPFCIAVIVVATALLPDSKVDESHGKMDVAGSILFALFVLLLLLGAKDIDFTAPAQSLAQPTTWGPLVGAAAAVVAFRAVERRAADPVFHLEYFHSRPIVVTMVVSFFIGCFVISLVLVPELAEYAMGDPIGSGGFYVLAIGLPSFVLTPMAGKLIDKLGPKAVLVTGLAISSAGLVHLALVAVAAPCFATLVAGLVIVGAGMGMSMGAPTNYMILENTDKAESSSAIATITLIRQIGTSIAPAIYVGLIASTPGLAGYQHMLLCVALFNLCALVTMLFYK